MLFAFGAVISCGSAFAAEREAQAQELITFDIPAQPLVSALNTYSAATHLALFYDGTLAVGRTSGAVQGVLTASAALRRLLENTDFEARASDVDTITIDRAETPTVRELAEIHSRSFDYEAYLGRVQAGFREALCRNFATQMDTNELLIRFWIASSGLIDRAELLNSTGSSSQDAAYAVALKAIDIGQPPPPGMRQPVTMVILPRPSPRAAGCTTLSRQTAVR